MEKGTRTLLGNIFNYSKRLKNESTSSKQANEELPRESLHIIIVIINSSAAGDDKHAGILAFSMKTAHILFYFYYFSPNSSLP